MERGIAISSAADQPTVEITAAGRVATVDDLIDTPKSETRTGRRVWRTVRAILLLAGLGLVGVLMVDPPTPFGEAAAGQAYVRAADRWITLGAEDPSSSPLATTSGALHATPALPTAEDDRSRRTREDDRSLRRRSAAENTSRSRSWGDSRNSRSGSLRNHSHSHSHNRNSRTQMPLYRQARASALQSRS